MKDWRDDHKLDDRLIARFLLGELPEAERDGLEQEYVTDPEYFERICEVENRLIDSYVRGTLSRKERGRFERNYLTNPVRRQKVAFAKSLGRATFQIRTADQRSREESRDTLVPWWQALVASFRAPGLVAQLSMAMAVVLLIVSVWVLLDRARLSRELVAARQERAALDERQRELERQIAEDDSQRGDLKQELEQLLERQRELETRLQQSEPRAPSVIAFVLNPGMSRGGAEAKPLRITPKTDFVRLQVIFDGNDYSSYEAQIKAVDGAQVVSKSKLKASAIKNGAAVTLNVPAKRLAGGDYILTLSGIKQTGEVEEITRYYFRVDRK